MLAQIVRTESSIRRRPEDSDEPFQPKRLTKLAGDVVNNIPMPKFWEWNVQDVVVWVENVVELPQYKDCFERNFINGRRLLLLEDHLLPRLGICQISHVKAMMKEIRKLSGMEPIDNNRSIFLPPRHPLTLYLQFRVPTGPTREATTRVEFFQKIGILDDCKSCPNKYVSPPIVHEFPCVRFGLVKRKNVYNRIEFDRPSLRTKRDFNRFYL